jgi:ubiquinone/menaquinone biosynthesis C-methylase UbiE
MKRDWLTKQLFKLCGGRHIMVKQVEDYSAFHNNWANRYEREYNHWTREEPRNQVQLAFRNHWLTFQQILKNPHFNAGSRSLEVGCGRGSLSAYFSDADYCCTLLDISPTVIERAQRIFQDNSLKADFVVGDALKLPFPDRSFDIVFSIGLMEHFSDIETLVKEQIRILDRGGAFIAYVVPEYKNNVQAKYNWINEILKSYADTDCRQEPKEDVFRTNYGSKRYVSIAKENGLTDVHSSGLYPLPMISHSIEFPFTLMPDKGEAVLVKRFTEWLTAKERKTGKNPWLCREGYGQAFLVWGFKQ